MLGPAPYAELKGGPMVGIPAGDDLVALAYLSCSLRGVARDSFEAAMAEEYLFLRRMMSPSSLTSRIAASVPIKCRVEAIELEESSNRLVVTFTADGQGDPERIRTDRLDGRNGELVRTLWSDIRPGSRAVVYKLNENASAARASGYRVAPYVVALR